MQLAFQKYYMHDIFDNGRRDQILLSVNIVFKIVVVLVYKKKKFL